MTYNLLMGDPNELLKVLERNAESRQPHFIDEHEETLISKINNVDAVVDELLEEDLLTDRQYNLIWNKETSEEKMKELYRYCFAWDTEDKDTFLEILRRHNGALITRIQSGDQAAAEESPLPCNSSEGYFRFSSGSSSSHVDKVVCDLCGKSHDPADIPVMPKISGNIYRLELKCPGRFCCLETGIKFQVTRPVSVEYELDSWHNYRDNPQVRDSQVLGPLFSIRPLAEPSAVSAVHLPHYLCLKKLSEDKSWIKCAHFKDGNLSVETPARVLPFHVVLENPSFSSLGVFCWNLLPQAVTKHIPIHGRVLLYFKTAGKKSVVYKVHLYLMPAFAPIAKEFLQEKTSNGFKKIDKPPRTKTIYTKKSYLVKGPEEADIYPPELEVYCDSPLDSYTDITIKKTVKVIDLRLEQEEGREKVWGCHIWRGEVEDLTAQDSKQKKPKVVSILGFKMKEQLVMRHREALISNVALVDPILDSLLSENMLNHEEYDTIRSKLTPQEKMRELYRAGRGWGVLHKAKFYDALAKYNAPVMEHLTQL